MAYADGNLYGAPITIPAAQVPANQTNFAVLLSSANMPAALLSFLAANGGGSLRAYLDEAQSVRYALEYVSATEVWICAPSLSSSTDTTIWLFWGGVGLTQPAVGDAYGRNAVWAAWSTVHHMSTDPTTTIVGARGNDCATTGMNSADLVPGRVGLANDFDGVDDYAISGAAIDHSAITAITLMGWISLAADQGFSFLQLGSKSLGYSAIRYSSAAKRWDAILATDNEARYVFRRSTTQPAYDGTWVHVSGVVTNTTARIFLDGVESVGTFATSGSPAFSRCTGGDCDRVVLGAQGAGLSLIRAGLDEARIVASALSADDILCHYRAQSSPATFAVFGTIVQPAAGGAITTLWSYYGG